MTGGTWVSSSRPNPTGENGWLVHKSWYTIQEMAEKIDAFKGFDTEFEENIDAWENIYNSAKPHRPDKEHWPGTWGEMTHFRRLLVLRALRPDKIVEGIQQLVKHDKELGKNYIISPAFDL
jgi:dynein heavy chain